MDEKSSLGINFSVGIILIVIPAIIMTQQVLTKPNGSPIVWLWIVGIVSIIAGLVISVDAYNKIYDL